MSNIPLDLQDLSPQDATFTLERLPGVTLTLSHWSLRVRSWAIKKWGHQGLQTIFAEQQIEPITELAYFMLKEKTMFPTIDDFTDKIVTTKDIVTVIKALLTTVGLGEPEIAKIDEALKEHAGAAPSPNVKSPKKKIGAKSSMP